MHRIGLIWRTVRYLKLIQIWNRVARRFATKRVKRGALALRAFRSHVAWPRYYRVGEGRVFTFLNETKEIVSATDWNNGAWKKLWLYNLHYFDCLRQEGGCEGSKALIAQWIKENPLGMGNGWEPYPISLRVVNWIKWALEGNVLDEAMRESLCLQVRWLRPRLEYHLLANHLLANAKALVFAGSFFEGREAEGWLKQGLAIYRKELPEQIKEDGVHFELSAMYHSIILEDLLDCYKLTGEEMFATYARKMVGALKALVGPDGTITKFNDAAEGIALKPDTLVAYARSLGVDSPCSELTSFLRQEAGEYTLIARMGEIGPKYQPGHAHADTYSFELWRGKQKIVTDTGTDRYVVDEERKRQRGTAAHNCVMIDGKNSSEVWGGHRVGRRFDGKGWTRQFVLTERGLEGVDTIRQKGECSVEIRFHSEGKPDFELWCPFGVRQKEEARICLEFGKSVLGTCVKQCATVRCPIEVHWRIC